MSDLEPMKASTTAEIPRGSEWVYEPKYDGIRVLAVVEQGTVRLVTRNGNDKARQFPELVELLSALREERGPMVLDGEVVALDAEGRPRRFQAIHRRVHLKQPERIREEAAERPAGFAAFDVLSAGGEDLTERPQSERRAALERSLRSARGRLLLPEVFEEPEPLLERAEAEGWEGIIAKRLDAPYRPGKRTDAWLKVKLEPEQEMVVGGWTEPRKTRKHIGALLLGYYEEGALVYAGHAGTGMTHANLEEMHRRLTRLERRTSPFREEPRTNEPAHWVRPEVVVQIRFNGWTEDGLMRQPRFVGFREDKAAKDVVREGGSSA